MPQRLRREPMNIPADSTRCRVGFSTDGIDTALAQLRDHPPQSGGNVEVANGSVAAPFVQCFEHRGEPSVPIRRHAPGPDLSASIDGLVAAAPAAVSSDRQEELLNWRVDDRPRVDMSANHPFAGGVRGGQSVVAIAGLITIRRANSTDDDGMPLLGRRATTAPLAPGALRVAPDEETRRFANLFVGSAPRELTVKVYTAPSVLKVPAREEAIIVEYSLADVVEVAEK